MSNTERAHRSTADMIGGGTAALRDAGVSLDGVVGDVVKTGREALRAAREVRDELADSLLWPIRTHPYATLAVAGLIGFACGAMRRC
jgi:hypothetical protein